MASEAAIESVARQYWDEGEAAMVRFGVRYLPIPWHEGDIEARATIIKIARQIINAFEQADEQKQQQRDAARWNDYVELCCLGSELLSEAWIFESTKTEINQAFDSEREAFNNERANMLNRTTLADPT